MDFVVEFLQNPPSWFSIAIIVMACSIFSKTIIKIFRMGVTFKTKLVTKDEQTKFEESVRNDMRSYRDEIQRNILTTCMNTVDRELASIKDMKELAAEMKTAAEVQRVQMQQFEEKFNEIKSVGDVVRQLTTRMDRLEYGADTAARRRTE